MMLSQTPHICLLSLFLTWNIQILGLFSKSYGCKWSDPALNASFDLCELQLTNESQYFFYEVFDKRATPNVSSFKYFFNVAADIATEMKFEECYNQTLREKMNKPNGYCPNIVNGTCASDLVPITATTAGYQSMVDLEIPSCYRLHDGVTEPTWSLIESTDPTKGVQLTYTNGDWCKNGQKNRELNIVLHCEDDYSNTFDREEQIEEYETCDYAIELYTIHGCPTECPYVDEQLCNGQGVCEFDFSNNRSKCFCYQGYYGDDCVDTEDTDRETIYEDDDESYVGGLIIVVILLVVMLAILGYLWLRFSNAQKGIVTSDKVKKIVRKKQKGVAGGDAVHAQLQSIDNVKDDSYDDDERVAV